MWSKLVILAIVVLPITYKIFENPIHKWANKVKTSLIKICIEQVTGVINNSDPSINIRNKFSATLIYEHLGQSRQITIPYDPKLARKMRKYTVYIIRDDGHTENITHHPGIPYFVSGHMLHAESVIIENRDTGDRIMWPNDTIIQVPPPADVNTITL